MTWGFKRGIFSNEAGLGSTTIVHAASNIKEPVHQGMWGIFEVFMDTVVVCSLTALVVLTSGLVDLSTGKILTDSRSTTLVSEAFTKSFGDIGGYFMAVSIFLFAFSTVLGWSYYGVKAWEFLFGIRSSKVYKVFYILFIMVGASMSLELVWSVSDTFNGLMMLPNLIGVLSLSGVVVKITRNYIDRVFKGRRVPPLLSAFTEESQQPTNRPNSKHTCTAADPRRSLSIRAKERFPDQWVVQCRSYCSISSKLLSSPIDPTDSKTNENHDNLTPTSFKTTVSASRLLWPSMVFWLRA